MKESVADLKQRFNSAAAKAKNAAIALDEAREKGEPVEELLVAFDKACAEAEALETKLDAAEAKSRARTQFKMAPSSQGGSSFLQVRVNEPDLYTRGGRSFFADLYAAQVKDSPDARERIDRHHRYEIEQRAVTSTSLGGIIPPAYLVDMYAKASRNGRVFADQVNQQTLPDVGMSQGVPRLTQGTAVATQSAENATVTTQDPTETDLTVNVRTLAGYSPVSRQSIERAAYSDQILFEDLIARYWAQLDTQALNGSGGTQLPGLLGTAGISSSTASTTTVAGIWPKIADLIQQISSAAGGLGLVADKVFMHPRRWAFFCAALDSQNRPLMLPSAPGGTGMNIIATGAPSGYGEVGLVHGLRAGHAVVSHESLVSHSVTGTKFGTKPL